MEINLKSREVSIKVVYYGPGLSGKTTNLEVIHEKTPKDNKGRLSSLATDQDRTLFFDYMPLELGEISGLKIRLRLFTVPGQVYYNSTRKLVLRCVDGVTFVADSQVGKNQENIESLKNLYANLKELDLSAEHVPIIMQYNKRDLPNIMSVDFMNKTLNNELRTDFIETVAVKGEGVFQTLKCIAAKTLRRAEDNIKNKDRRAKKVVPVHQGETKTMSVTPAIAKMPKKTKFQLNFNKKREESSQFQTTFKTSQGEESKLNKENSLPFKVNPADASKTEIKNSQEESTSSKKSTETMTQGLNSIEEDKVNLRKSSGVFRRPENLELENTDNEEKIAEKPDTQEESSKKRPTTLFRGSLIQSSHLKLNSKKSPDSTPNKGLKDRLKNLEKFKKIFDE